MFKNRVTLKALVSKVLYLVKNVQVKKKKIKPCGTLESFLSPPLTWEK